jgi:hypothetical protein
MTYKIQSYSFAAFIAEVEGKRSNVEDGIRANQVVCFLWHDFFLVTEGERATNLPMQAHRGRRHIKLNTMVWVRERTIPTERPPLVGEVIDNFCVYRVPRGQRDGSLLPYSRFSRQEPLLFYQVAPQLYPRGWVDPVPDPLLVFLVVPGIEPWPLDL